VAQFKTPQYFIDFCSKKSIKMAGAEDVATTPAIVFF
jgi:hypothetical protein